ncbi:arginine deiminase [Gluconacetobacter entanii]|uniref:arginine deiminase n=1 Tax=Gluconacetobacter entanii TaxID=108528 RepID=A0A318Q0U7_9PROT|nr:arginine deiminase family protein [Gluconacetobacter entanii]MBY4639858.1 arginine deiminase [Gluconacetobacter entanii]MCW4581119.1 arginine deiminase family protein [Gluconacetobacter entanii]MCW4584379.1 arginine deiminase family protein [Gluconacetobacter entanii]MCW4587793.1 arginine deiminase family protein [Gluconacetobacter entanii]MCW4590269.1 arginine deiminase family protein [Gluconacetobacter entanii]
MNANHWFMDSESGTLADVLLCRPEHYSWIPSNDIAIQTLASGRRTNHADMLSQFDELVDALRMADVNCHFMTPQSGMPYEVYTRDSSQTTPFGTVVTRMSRPERRAEEGAVRQFYAPGEIWKTCTQGHIEGGDIHFIRPGLLVIGVSGGRTDEDGARQFADWFIQEGWTCRLIRFPAHFLHLDVIFTMINDDTAIAVTDVLPDADLAWLRAQGIRLLPVSYKEAMNDMGCNVLALGKGRVISPRHSTRINQMMRAEGMEVLTPHLEQFSRGGGSVHCMTMPLRRASLAR